LGLDFNGKEIAFKLMPGRATGNNFVAAVQLVNKEVNKRTGVEAGQRDRLKTEDFIRAQEQLEDILNSLTRQFKKMEADNG
jgi:hypothetical protein